MKKAETTQLTKIEDKIDDLDKKVSIINDKVIRTEVLMDTHIQDHKSRVKWGLALLGIFGTIISAFIIGLGKSIWAWILELITK